uniref:Endonuclease/exonuclease/phosphatase domain-containing protein n=1 Tax=Chromera velia CCMP2878 TaxID=1169474 RepID=A0A0G4HTG3_9ALVE|eukprot:Cvel_31441.t1-p1 / transcript=Cvel_31441.t1 / gene=Cvel_31441 / organism=Chromera_velia_CCMP2878 / gene_product=hypothetical protein / transcript_product=hypothetical protein / location=Cvel_scaffold4689:2218-3245(-) / protein_length=167 / sequence_SO=supercontig / SO=protein_coding / is_pseudo=false
MISEHHDMVVGGHLGPEKTFLKLNSSRTDPSTPATAQIPPPSLGALILKRGETMSSTGGVAVLLSCRARSVGWEEERLSNAAAMVRHPDLNTPLLCGVYDPCADSTHADDTFLTDLKDRLEKKRREGEGTSRRRTVCVGGDFNARTGSEAPRLTFGENAGEGGRRQM